MHKKIIILCIILSLLFSCTTTAVATAEPQAYTEDEFPQWSLDLRRAEIIFLGAIPLSYMLTNIAYDLYMENFSETEGDSQNYNNDEHTQNKLTIALSASAIISLTDYILGLFEKEKN